jgi:hypothetical protein
MWEYLLQSVGVAHNGGCEISQRGDSARAHWGFLSPLEAAREALLVIDSPPSIQLLLAIGGCQ